MPRSRDRLRRLNSGLGNHMAKREQLTSDDEASIVKEFEAQSDRGVTIVAAAYLDAKLQEILEHYFSETLSPRQEESLFRSPNAPLNSFSSRIRMAHALGLIGPKTEHDLHIIRDLRNEFAHRLLVQDFSNEEIKRKCQALKLAELSILGGTPPSDPRKRLIQSAVLSLHFLYGELRARKAVATPPTVSP